MSSRLMSKSVVLAALLLMSLPVMAFAQTSRLEGMTLQGDYVKDYTGIYAYPSQVTGVGNLVYGELGNTGGTGSSVSDRSIGSVLGNLFDGRVGTWVLHLRQTTPGLASGDAVSSPTDGTLSDDRNTNNNEEFDLMWGRKVGTMSIGLRFNRSFWQMETSAPGVQTTLAFDPSAGSFPPAAGDTNAHNLARNIVGFGGGVGFEVNPNTNVEVGLLYQSRTFEKTNTPVPATPPGDNEKEDSSTSYMLSGRAMWQWQSNTMITPVVKFYSYDLSRQMKTVSQGTQTQTNTLSGWQIGAAANWSLGSNDMLVWGLDFVRNKLEQDDALVALALPGGGTVGANTDITESVSPRLFAALETHVNPWLTLRMGASKGAYTKLKVEPRAAGSTTVEITRSSFDMNIGAGVKLGTVQLDAVLANNTLQMSNGLLGGSNTPTGGYFPKVTATYSF